MAGITLIPYDFTGTALSNRRTNETHTLMVATGKTNRAFVCKHGAFYSKSMVIRDATTIALKPGIDYKTVYHYQDLSTLTGKEIMGFVVITNPAVKSPVSVSYQAVGGPFAVSVDELKALLATLDVEDAPLVWGDIIGKPDAYRPDPKHLHKYWQLYGLETTVKQIDRIADAWQYGSKAIIEYNKTYSEDSMDKAQIAIDEYQAAVTAHITNMNNPHVLTPAQVQREKLNNWGMSGLFDITNKTNDNTYFPIGGVYQILSGSLLPRMNAHVINYNNPHGVTAEMLGVNTKGYVDNALSQKLVWGETAADAALFSGVSYTTMYNAARTAIPCAEVVSGMFPANQLGTGIGNNSNYVLTANNVWTHWAAYLALAG